MGKLFLEIEQIAKGENVHDVFISTNHTGLYEKYGCEFYEIMSDMNGELSRVYRKRIDLILSMRSSCRCRRLWDTILSSFM